MRYRRNFEDNTNKVLKLNIWNLKPKILGIKLENKKEGKEKYCVLKLYSEISFYVSKQQSPYSPAL